MQNKGLKLQLMLLVVLLSVLGVAVVMLFSGKEDKSVTVHMPAESPALNQEEVLKCYPGLTAVPLDAVMVFGASSVSKALDILCDNESIAGPLINGTGKVRLDGFLDSLKTFKEVDGPCMVSVHYDKALEPLMIISECSLAEHRSRLAAMASGCSLQFAVAPDADGDMVLISSSRVIIEAALRHLQVGSSILENVKFASAVTAGAGKEVIAVSCSNIAKLATQFLPKEIRSKAQFFASYTDYLSFMPVKVEDGYDIRLRVSSLDNPAFLAWTMDGSKTAAQYFLPPETVFAVSITTGGMESYIKKFKTHLDAKSILKTYRDSAEKWAKGLDIQEIAVADVMTDGNLGHILLIKTGSRLDASVLLKESGIASLKEYKPAIMPYLYRGYAAVQFGDLFSLEDESEFFYKDGWLFIGDNNTLTDLLVQEYQPLCKAWNKLDIGGTSPFVYYEAVSGADNLKNVFLPRILDRITAGLNGLVGKVMVIEGGSIKVRKILPAKSSAKIDPSLVSVPEGPFPVYNFFTKKTNQISQNADNSIVLTDEKGKKLWTKELPGRICGTVGETDYYNNKRIQFVFATGSKLYMMDRLGNVVKGFPSELGKEVLLGPAIYDFTGAKGYSAIVLHTDNTIGMYNLHGEIRKGWKGIAPPEQVLQLPELSEENGKKVWKVVTSTKIYIYPFYGGEPIAKEKRKTK